MISQVHSSPINQPQTNKQVQEQANEGRLVNHTCYTTRRVETEKEGQGVKLKTHLEHHTWVRFGATQKTIIRD